MESSNRSASVTSQEDVWRFCSVCKRNHEEGRKHIFTKKHVNKLKILMGKFLKKARSARRCLSHPRVLSGELEPGAKVWCYCCEEEVNKHVTDGKVSVEWAGLLEHMTKPDHHKNTRHYWWETGAETRHLQTLLLFPAEYQQYKELVARAMEDLEKSREDRVRKLADDVRATEQKQAAIASEPLVSRQPPLSIRTYSDVSAAHGSRQAPPPHSVLKRQGGQSGRGNVHTGATPPWLRDDDEGDEEGVIIGPSEEEFIKHRERTRHAGKNPKRVGADFHLKLALQKHRGEKEDDDWLPSFGRVWNPGPRSHTQSEFRHEVAQERKQPKLHSPSVVRTHDSHSITTHSHTSFTPPTPHTSFTPPTPHTSFTPPTSHTSFTAHRNHIPKPENTTSQLREPVYTRKRSVQSQDLTNGLGGSLTTGTVDDSATVDLSANKDIYSDLEIKPYTRRRKICKVST